MFCLHHGRCECGNVVVVKVQRVGVNQSRFLGAGLSLGASQPEHNWTSHWIQGLGRFLFNCSSQPSMVHWLSSSIFPCLFVRRSVRPALVTSDQISTFFNIYWHKSHTITQYHLIQSSTKLN